MTDARHDQRSRVTKMHAAITCKALSSTLDSTGGEPEWLLVFGFTFGALPNSPGRDIKQVTVSDADKVAASATNTKVKADEFNSLTNPNTHVTWVEVKSSFSVHAHPCWHFKKPRKASLSPRLMSSEVLKREFQTLMRRKTKEHWWPATTQNSEFNQITSSHWFFEYWPNKHLFASGANTAWLSTLAGAPGQAVAEEKHGRIFLILAVGAYGFVGWQLEFVGKAATGFSVFRPVQDMSINFLHVTDLDDWVSVPVKPCLADTHGPVQLEQTSAAMDLATARMQEGINLTCQQAKDLLKLLGVQFRGNMSRASLLGLLLDYFLDTEAEKNAARAKMKLAAIAVDDEELDSDYEELIGALQDSGNAGTNPSL